MRYVADSDEYGFWYVREEPEMARPRECRDWAIIVSKDSFEDNGEAVALKIAELFSLEG